MTANIASEANPPQNPYLNDPDRPIFAVCRLMRLLPDDIANARTLTPDQAQMAHAVAFYAHEIQRTVVSGLAEIGKLMHESASTCADSMPNIGRLIKHLGVEAEFMQDAAQEYRDAVKEACHGV
jgi:urease gamma subunit